jgi:hypothetical protein
VQHLLVKLKAACKLPIKTVLQSMEAPTLKAPQAPTVQQQIQNAQKKAGGYRGNYYKPRYPKANTSQSQGSAQYTNQSGAAIDGSVNAQDSVTGNVQTQRVRGR